MPFPAKPRASAKSPPKGDGTRPSRGWAAPLLTLVFLGAVFVGILPTASAAALCAPAFNGGASPVAGGTFAAGPAVGSVAVPPAASEIAHAGVSAPTSSTETFTVTLPSGTTFNGAVAASQYVVRQTTTSLGGSCGAGAGATTWQNPASVAGPGASSPPVLSFTMSGNGWRTTNGLGEILIAASASGAAKMYMPCSPGDVFNVATANGSGGGPVAFTPPSGVAPTPGISGVTAATVSTPADGSPSLVIKVQAKDAGAKACVPGKRVMLSSTRGPLDFISAPPPLGLLADAWGQATFTVSSCTPGAATFNAVAAGSGSDIAITQAASIAFTAAATACSVLAFLDQPQDTAQGLPFVPTIRVRVADTAGNPMAGQAVTLAVAGNPAGVHLVSGPGQDLQPAPPTVPTPPAAPIAATPTATTDAAGIAAFTGVAMVIDNPAFVGAVFQLRAASGGGTIASEPFAVGRTGVPWMQFNFNAQRTGWSPNIADFSDPAQRTVIARVPVKFQSGANNYFGDVGTAPLLADENGDGTLDLIVANGVNRGMMPAAGPAIFAWDLSSCAGGCAPALIWRNILAADANGAGNGSDAVYLAALYGPGQTKPTYLAANIVNLNAGAASLPFKGQVTVYFNGVQKSLLTPGGGLVGSPFPFSPLVAYVGPGGAAAVVEMEGMSTASATTSTVHALVADSTGALVNGPSSNYKPLNAAGGALAVAEMRAGNAVPEIVSATAEEGTAGQGGWDTSTLALCTPTPVTMGCTELSSLTDAAVNGLSIADLDGDGKPDIIANGLRSGTWSAPNPSQGQLNVFPGTTAPLGGPVRLAEGSDFYNTAALASLDAPRQDGLSDIVNVNNGAPPVADDSAGDTYSDLGNVYARAFKPGGPAIADEGVWVRGGTAPQPTESPGGGILLTLDPRPAHGYRPDFVFGSRDGTVTAASVIDASSGTPPTSLWSLGNLGSSTAIDSTQGIPISPLAAGDITGDCHAELFAGLSMGRSLNGEVAVIKGKDATPATGPLFTSNLPAYPNDYTSTASWTGAALPDQDTAPGHGFKAKLAWNPPADDGGLPVVEYKVYRGTTPGFSPGGANLVGIWPSGTPPTFTAATAPAYRPFIDNVPSEGDFYYKVGAVTCFSLNHDPNGIGVPSAPFEVEVKFGKAGNLRAVPSGTLAFPDPIQVNIGWDRSDNMPRPNGCEWADAYNIYKSTSSTGVVAAGNKMTAAPFNSPIAAGPLAPFAPPSYVIADPNVARAPWNGPGGLYYYVVNPVNCVGEQNVDPNPPYTDPPANQVLANTRLPKSPNLNPPSLVSGPVGIQLSWTPDSIANGCAATAAGAGGAIMGYEIYRGTSPGAEILYDTVLPSGPFGPPAKAAPWDAVTPTANPAPGAIPTSYLDTNLASNTVYYYDVATVNCVGESLPSNEQTLRAPNLPMPPTGLLARPYGDPAYAVSAPKKAELDWTALTAAQWSTCTGGKSYNIYRGPAGGPYSIVQTVASATSTWTDDGTVSGFPLTVGLTYGYVVTSFCTAPIALESTYSFAATADVTLPNTAGAPTATLLSSPPRIHLAWTDPGPNNDNCNWEEGYRIYRQDNGAGGFNAVGLVTGTPQSWTLLAPRTASGWGAPATAAPVWFDDSTVAGGNVYAYKVSAVNCVGEGAQSAVTALSGGNAPPKFQDPGPPATTLQSAVATSVTIPSWAYNIQAGPAATEGSQTLSFTTSYASGSMALFQAAPAVAFTVLTPGPFTTPGWGDLTYTVQANECGTATYKVIASDDGAMTPPPNLAAAASIDHALVITVTCRNASPAFVPGGNLPTVLEDSPAATLAAWASSITAGTPGEDATQKLAFATVGLSNAAMFATPPTVHSPTMASGPFTGSGWGDLTYTLAPDACGSASFQVRLADDGSNAAPNVNAVTYGPFTLDVTCVNDPPVFTASNELVRPTAGHRAVTDWATGIAPARATATDEQWGIATQQHMVFTTTYTFTSGHLSFSEDPVVGQAAAACTPSSFCSGLYDSSTGWGTLTYGVTPGAEGVAAVLVCLRDDGGTANGGLDKSCKSFTITSKRGVASGEDADSDGIVDTADNCPAASNADQADSDHNGVGDACQAGDASGAPPATVDQDLHLASMPSDLDLDGIADSADNCPTTPNRDQADLDRDGIGDSCDADLDGDGVANLGPSGTRLDNCLRVPNANQLDADGNGVGDACQSGADPASLKPDYSVPPGSSPLSGGKLPRSTQPWGVTVALVAGWLGAAGAIFFAVVRRRRRNPRGEE